MAVRTPSMMYALPFVIEEAKDLLLSIPDL